MSISLATDPRFAYGRLAQLTNRQRLVVMLLYGLPRTGLGRTPSRPVTREEAAQRLNLTPADVLRLEIEALDLLEEIVQRETGEYVA